MNKNKKFLGIVASALILGLLLTVSLFGNSFTPVGFWLENAYGGSGVGGEGTVVEKYFHEMTQDEKDRVLAKLIVDGEVPNFIGVKGKTYSLNVENWNSLGVISYGITSTINAENQNTSHPNYKDGQWRYLGYDMYGGLYGNDNFPPDYPSSTPPENKNWMTRTQVKASGAARNLIGESTVEKDLDFSNAEKRQTAALFLAENPGWRAKGREENYIIDHFFFNAVVKANGLTQGQFVGVHSLGGGVIRYQTFSVSTTVKFVVPPPESPAPDPQGPAGPEDPQGPAGPGEPGPVIPPAPDIGVNCQLYLPIETYVGHPTLAEDGSVFNLDGEIYSAARAYNEGLASNNFSVTGQGNSIRKIAKTKAEAVFANQGTYNVQLKVNADGGSSGTDIKSILVKPTPTIIHGLKGSQKQNRKLTLDIRVAKNPGSGLETFWVKIDYLDKGESVTLHHSSVGGNTLSNSESIKTRPIKRLATSDMYYEDCQLEFLIKNPEYANCRYTIYVEDNRGNTDMVVEDFDMAPDKAPEAEIAIDGAFVREQGLNIAKIRAEDVSLTDGDQLERTWFFRPLAAEPGGGGLPQAGDPGSPGPGDSEPLPPWQPINEAFPGYGDLSFGSGKSITFHKEGVGYFELKLFIRDLWTEETLEEYVSLEDRLTAETMAFSQVINIAPIVDLKAVAMKKASITVLAGGDRELNEIRNNKARIEAALLEQGIDASIKEEKIMPLASSSIRDGAEQTLEIRTPFSYEGNWLFYENDNYIADDEFIYKLDATWPAGRDDPTPESPFTISCWTFDAGGTNDIKWKYTFKKSVFDVPNVRTGPYFAQDDSGRYLFFAAGGKTLIISKDNGSKLTVLPMEVGENNYVSGHNIYTVKSDGIYRISALTGKIDRIYKGEILNGKLRRLMGMVHFVTGGNKTWHRGLFDPEDERIYFEPLDFNEKTYGLHDHEILSIDTAGKIVVNTKTRERRGSGALAGDLGNYLTRTHVYDRNNKLIFETPTKSDSSSYVYTVAPVLDEGGVCNYLVHSWNTRSSNARRTYNQLYRISDGYTLTGEIKGSKNDYPAVASKQVFVREIKGKVYVCNGAEWVYVWQTGFNIYLERLKTYVFDPGAETYRAGSLHSELGIGLVTFESGYSSDTIAVLQAGYNYPGQGYSLNQVIKWDQSLAMVLKRYVGKHMNNKGDINLLLVYDESNPSKLYSAGLKNEMTGLLADNNGEFVIASREDIVGQGLINKLKDRPVEEKALLVSVAKNKTGTLTQSFTLKAGKRYYYEYEIKKEAESGSEGGSNVDFLDLSHEATATNGAQYGGDNYKVVAWEEEDFEDANKLNPFFRCPTAPISEGFYKGADLVLKANSNAYRSHPAKESDTILKFTVPKGVKGHLSFDYIVQKANENTGASWWTQSYVKIDGKLWAAYKPSGGKGHYSHPHLLEPGEHVLTFFASEYGTSERAKLWLDDIRVDLLETCPASSQNPVEKDLLTREDTGGGFVKHKGSFVSLPPIPYYSQVSNAIAIDGKLGTAPYTVITNSDPEKKAFKFNIPLGKTAIYTRIPTVSRSSSDHTVSYSIPMFTYENDDGKTKTATDKWIYRPTIINSTERFSSWPADGLIFAGPLNEPKEISLYAWAYRSAYGDMTGITSVIVDNKNVAWKDLNYFITGSGSNVKYCLEKEKYKGVKFSFTLPQGIYSIKNLKIYRMEDGRRVYDTDETFTQANALSRWTVKNAVVAIGQAGGESEEETEKSLIYRKGEGVSYGVSYFDYENDPSKAGFWKYTHMPFNDGPHPEAAVILNSGGEPVTIKDKTLSSPINSFLIDGKYMVDHWQEDNTARPALAGGNPDYDKPSNVVSLTFYVMGEGAAPWVESISTSPAKVKEGDAYQLEIKVDDHEKDVLELTTELYFEGEMIFHHKKTGIKAAANGKYPPVLTGFVPEPAVPGRYEVVCTVRDQSGVGLGNHRFTVVSEGKIIGLVYHTDQWDENRKRYNRSYFNEEVNRSFSLAEYLAMSLPRKRGTNVFWSGEKFMLEAFVAGSPSKVTAEIVGYPGYKVNLVKTGGKNLAGEWIYKGELWDRAMLNSWGKGAPVELTFLFKAEYGAGLERTFEDKVIMDSNVDYWLLHRVW